MKKILLPLLLAGATSTLAQTNYPGNIPGCVARWIFSANGASGILSDMSGNNNTGLMHNMTSTTGWRGLTNTAMRFNGNSSYANVANSSTLTPQLITMVALVKLDTFYSGLCQINMILDKGTPNGIPGNYNLNVSDQIYDNNCNAFNPTKEMTGGWLGSASVSAPILPPVVQAGKWYFLALSLDSTKVDCYQVLMDPAVMGTNIQPVWSTTNPGITIGTNTQDLTIGMHPDPNYPYWVNGVMDEVAIFNRKLTPSEMQTVYSYLWTQPTAVDDVTPQQNAVTATMNNGLLSLNSTDGAPLGEVIAYNIAGQKLAQDIYSTPKATLRLNMSQQQIVFIKVAHKGTVATLKVLNN